MKMKWKDGEKKNLWRWRAWLMVTPLEVCRLKDKWANAATWENQDTQDKTRCRRRQSSHNSLSIWVEFLYSQIPIWILQEPTPLFIVWGCWKIGGKIQMKLIWKSHKKQVTWEVWPFSTMTPPKNYTYTYSPKSQGQCDFILHILTPLFNIHTSYNYTRVIQEMLFYLMLGLAPHEMAWAFWALAFLGLGFGLGLWAWASSFEKTNKKNFKWFGPCPFFLLTTSFWFSSYSSSWREFVHEFWIPAYNKVNLFLQLKLEEKGKHDLVVVNNGISEKEVL